MPPPAPAFISCTPLAAAVLAAALASSCSGGGAACTAMSTWGGPAAMPLTGAAAGAARGTPQGAPGCSSAMGTPSRLTPTGTHGQASLDVNCR
uniref:Putative secreted protein n=1 Tax=Ixodes ricinus TaxID=34613 RepID=A0A6B0UBP9_IXORI